MMIPDTPRTPTRLTRAGAGERAGVVRREDNAELNRLLGQATRCLEDMDLRGANEILKQANDEASGLSHSRTREVEM